MLEKTRGIVLRCTAYSDSSVIAHIYTETSGMRSYLIHGVRNQKGSVRPAHLLPVNLVEMIAYHSENRELHRVKELKCDPVLQRIHFDPYRRSLALFVTEILDACITGQEQNQELFSFLWHCVNILDSEGISLSLFAPEFLIRLSCYLGFEPDHAYQAGQMLDLEAGRFCNAHEISGSIMDPVCSSWVHGILNGPADRQIELTRAERRNLLDDLLKYYQYHGLHGRAIRSHHILRDVL